MLFLAPLRSDRCLSRRGPGLVRTSAFEGVPFAHFSPQRKSSLQPLERPTVFFFLLGYLCLTGVRPKQFPLGLDRRLPLYLHDLNSFIGEGPLLFDLTLQLNRDWEVVQPALSNRVTGAIPHTKQEPFIFLSFTAQNLRLCRRYPLSIGDLATSLSGAYLKQPLSPFRSIT